MKTAEGLTLCVPVVGMETLEFNNSRVCYLSTLNPRATIQEDMFGLAWPVRIDRSVSNQPIRLGNQNYARGIGVHAPCELTYDLTDDYTLLVAAVGIDDAVRPRGKVVFRVVGDNRELFSGGPLSGNDPPQKISVDIRGVHQLRLIVEATDDLDFGDHADWADVRLIK